MAISANQIDLGAGLSAEGTNGRQLGLAIDAKDACVLATAAALPANTASGTGVGKTLTATANGALTVDGVAVANGNRILVKDEGTAANDGIYVVTDLGSAGTPYILTRATDSDEDSQVSSGSYTVVLSGTANGGTIWFVSNTSFATVDTDAWTWASLTAASTLYTADGTISGTARTVTHATSGAAQDLIFDLTGANDASIILQSAGTGTDAISLLASAGGVRMLSSTGGLDADFNAASALTNTGASMTMSVAAVGAGQDLILQQTGANDSGVLIQAAGTGVDAIKLNATAGGFDIDSVLASTITTTGNSMTVSVVADAAAEDLLIAQTGAVDASVHLQSNGTGTDAIKIEQQNATGGMQLSSAGDVGIVALHTGTAGGIALSSSGSQGVVITASGQGAGVKLAAGDGTDVGSAVVVEAQSALLTGSGMVINSDVGTTAATAGVAVATQRSATTTTGSVFTAGADGGVQPIVTVASAAGFAAGDLVQIVGSDFGMNDGIYEVDSVAGSTLVMKSTNAGTNDQVTDFSRDQFIALTGQTATVSKVTVSALRAGTDGLWEQATGDTTSLTYSDLATSYTARKETVAAATFTSGATSTFTVGNTPVTVAAVEEAQELYRNGVLHGDKTAGAPAASGEWRLNGTSLEVFGTTASDWAGDVFVVKYHSA